MDALVPVVHPFHAYGKIEVMCSIRRFSGLHGVVMFRSHLAPRSSRDHNNQHRCWITQNLMNFFSADL